MRLIHWFFRWLNIISIVLLLLSYLAPYVSAKVFWPLGFIGMAYPFLLLINLIFFFYWIILKKRFAIYSLIAIIIGVGYVKTVIGFNFNKEQEVGASKVLSYNVASLNIHHPIVNPSGFLGFPILDSIDSKEFDLAALQEFPNHGDYRIIKRYKLFKHKYATNYIFYTGTNSPILKKGTVAIDGKNGVTWIDTKLNGKKVRIYNVHLKSNRISSQTNKFAFRKDLFSRKIFPYIKHVLIQIRERSKIRAEQAEKLAKHIAECPHPIIVCGDFNEVPLSYPYRVISNGLKDAFEEKGSGFGFTFAGKIPGLRLDYFLVSEEIEVFDFKIENYKYSDHYPLIVDLKVK